MHGTYETIDDQPMLRFERVLAHPVDEVWQALTDPAELAVWFPTHVEGDLEPGGRLTFTFPRGEAEPMTGEVLELDPPRRYVFTWGEDELRFELEPTSAADGCVLRFDVVLGTRDKAARDAAGWHVCLDALRKLLDGAQAERPWASDEWKAHYEAYTRHGLPTGAPVPS
jgi:uncharacterized protein YndB with AHSA1/START domain